MNEVGRLYGNNIVFPQLGIDITVDNEAFSLFGLSIKWYGVLIALGMLLAMIYCFKRTKEFGIDGDRLTDVVFAGLIGAVIGARLYYVALHPESFKDIRDVLAIRDGGLAVYGGILGALLFGFVTAKIRKLRILPTFDLVAMGFFIGQAAGRWGNFFNQEAFGSNTSLPWGMSGGRIQQYLANHQASLAAQGMEINPYLPVHPCFLYESIWCVIGFVILHFYHKHRRFDGEIFCMYVFWYGLGRFFIEGLRTDSLYIGSVRASQLLAAVSALAALAVIIAMRIRAKKNGVHLYRDTEESAAILEAEAKAEAEEAERKRAKKHKELTAEQRIIDDEDESDSETE
ncbi:MAG: prolipoprotein diacylglyceryl transferase [Oscillospiraceae bacterium]|nr:prolipoprotein diacylglyceryl transferase [Oscillospiraceae bacterium]